MWGEQVPNDITQPLKGQKPYGEADEHQPGIEHSQKRAQDDTDQKHDEQGRKDRLYRDEDLQSKGRGSRQSNVKPALMSACRLQRHGRA